jgi:hypothetical protein
MKILGIVFLALLIGAGSFVGTEFLRAQVPVSGSERCSQAAPSARQAYDAGPMGRGGLRLAEMGAASQAETPAGAFRGLILCRAEASFASGARDTMWFALVPAANGRDGEFMVHAAPGDLGRRNILANR